MEVAAPLHRRPVLYLAGWLVVAITASLFITLVAQPADRVSLAEASGDIVMALLGQGLLLVVSVGVFAAAVARFDSRWIRLAAVPLGIAVGVAAQAGFVSMLATDPLASVLMVIAAPFIQPFWVAVLMSVLGFWLPYLIAIEYAVLAARKSVLVPVAVALVGLVAASLVGALLTRWPLAPW